MKLQLSQPVPELPVEDLKASQEYYRDAFGFEFHVHHEVPES